MRYKTKHSCCLFFILLCFLSRMILNSLHLIFLTPPPCAGITSICHPNTWLVFTYTNPTLPTEPHPQTQNFLLSMVSRNISLRTHLEKQSETQGGDKLIYSRKMLAIGWFFWTMWIQVEILCWLATMDLIFKSKQVFVAVYSFSTSPRLSRTYTLTAGSSLRFLLTHPWKMGNSPELACWLLHYHPIHKPKICWIF